MKSVRPSLFFALLGVMLAARSAAAGEPGLLKKGFDALGAGDAKAAAELFDAAAADESLSSWAAVGKALALEKLVKKKDALETIESISGSDAASLDATVFRLVLAPDKIRMDDIGAQRQILERYDRQDLVPKLLAAALTEAVKRKEANRAVSFYKELCPPLFKHYTLPLGYTGGPPEDLFDSILPLLSGAERDAALLFEAQRALSFRNPERAREALAKRTIRDSAGEIVRAKSLRALGKSDEAFGTLVRAAKEIRADRESLLLETVRLAWNENRLEDTRRYSAELSRAFPRSRAADEARHSAALSWITAGDWAKGTRELEVLARSKPVSEYQALSQRDLAWLALRKNNLSAAARWFSEYRESSAVRLESAKGIIDASERNKQLRDAKFEVEHAQFWLAETCSRAPEKQIPDVCRRNPPAKIFEALLGESPVSYYRMLAAARLGRPFPPPELTAKRKNANPDRQCPLPAAFDKRLNALREEELAALVHSELAYFFSQPFGHLKQSDELPAELRGPACRIILFERYGDFPAGIRAAETLLRTEPAGTSVPADALFAAAFPRPFLPEYERAAREKGVPVAFALAITRTESHFDFDARSTSDARGLMQLLPSTARMEGLDDPDRLFSPETNIEVGTRHLVRLFKTFHGNDDLVAGAYNGGAAAVVRWKQRTTPGKPRPVNDFENLGMDAWIETIPYGETRNYIKKVRLAKKWYEAPRSVP